jgi:hypothetical protein
VDVSSDLNRSPSRWDRIRSNHLRLSADLALARISLEAARLLAHGADPSESGRTAYTRAAEHYDKARHLLDLIHAELSTIERNRGWEPAPPIRTGPLPGERRKGTDRRSNQERRVLWLAAVQLERRHGPRRHGQRRAAPAV